MLRVTNTDLPTWLAPWIAALKRRPGTAIVAGMVALLALGVAMAFLTRSCCSASPPASPTTIIAGQAPPPVEPLVFAPMDAAKAKAINDTIPFAKDRGPAARSFQFAGDTDSRERAVDCLAGAMWYEAGGDPHGQRAVAQVVLNRVRHPAFPGTVCGVVFQGSERSTGCQFTFTCDGALHRIPSPEAFALTRERARAMLEGRVQPDVGLATHYHTDWVHPIWSAKLEKIGQVDTHLFFRWSGVWGTPAAQRKAYRGDEPMVTALGFLSPFHRPTEAMATESAAALAGGLPPPLPKPVDLGGGRYRFVISSVRNGNVQATVALDLCGTKEYCKLTGVLDQPGMIGKAPVAFVYVRNRAANFERAMWDCDVFKRPVLAQCFGKVHDVPDLPAPNPNTPNPEASAAPAQP